MPLDSLEQQLEEILEQINGEQQSVLALLDQQHQAMTQRDLTRLSELATALVSRAEHLQNLEQQRSALTRQITTDHPGLEADASLNDIANLASSPERRESLTSLRQRLLETQQQVADARDRNQTLAANVLEANDAALRNLMDALRKSGYGPDDSPRVVDRRA